MQTSESTKSLSVALAKAQVELKDVGKSGHNKYDNYRYATLEDYVASLRPVMSKHGLSIFSSVEEIVSLDDRTTQKGGIEHAVRVRLVTRITHESGEWIEGSVWGEGQDRADKAIFKSVTGARKYGLALAMGLATTDDPESDTRQPQPAAPRQQPAARRETVNKKTGEVIQKASKAQVDELASLLYLVPEETLEKWLDKANITRWEDMPADAIVGCIDYAKKRKPATEQAKAA